MIWPTRQARARELSRWELFKKVLHVPGSVVVCGVADGMDVCEFALASAILEPTAYLRTVIGFDTFEGFPDDVEGAGVAGQFAGDYYGTQDEIRRYTVNHPLLEWHAKHPKVELVKGDFMQTGEEYVYDNPDLLISLLYLDFNAYEPTDAALRLFRPLMAGGGLVVVDELSNPRWPGQNRAVYEHYPQAKWQRFTWEPNIAWVVV